MNQFPTLIEYLLLNHDYVVIPGLGTFIVQQMNAQRNELEEAFLPPFRSVRFNAGLKQDDSLLLSSIEEIFSVTPIQAEQMLATWVTDFKQTLEDNGCVEFGAIGVFTLEDDGSVIFTSQESGVTTPEYYGLDAFHMNEVTPAPKARVVPLTASMEADEREITIRINRRIANYVVAACAAILLFVVFNNPIPNNLMEGQHSSVKEMLVPQGRTPKADAPKTEKPVAEVVEATPQPEAEQEAPEAEATEAETAVSEARTYCIVMASAISQANAERFVQRLTNDGFVSARIIGNNKMRRVVVGRFADEAEANKTAHDIRQRSKDYSSAWVYKL